MARERLGGRSTRLWALGALAAALVLVPPPAAALSLVPVLGNSYVAVQQTFNPGTPNQASGSFATASWWTMAGDRTNVASGSGSNVVWDVRNNSIAYVLDRTIIRVVDFANPTSATAVTTLAIPGYTTFPPDSYGRVLTASMCGDKLTPQTLYVLRNQNGYSGSVLAIKLDYSSGLTVTTTLFNTQWGPSFCAVESSGRYVYVADNYANVQRYSAIRKLDTQSTPATPTYTDVAGGLTTGAGSGCDFDGPALGAGYVCYANTRGLLFDASERYLYFSDGNSNYVRVLDLQTSTVTRVAGDKAQYLGNVLESGISHFPPAPARTMPFGNIAGLAWNIDKTVMYIADCGYHTLPVRALSFSSPTSATMYDFSINHGEWVTAWGGTTFQADAIFGVAVNPADGTVFLMSDSLWSLGIPPPPPPPSPPPPPNPPNPPPNPPPAQAPLTVACWDLAHRFRAAPAVGGVYADSGAVGGWTGAAMGWLSPLNASPQKYPNVDYRASTDYGIAVLNGDYDAPLGRELYSTQWRAFSFTGEEGVLMDVSSHPYIGSASDGLSIAIWFTPRGTALGPQSVGDNTLLMLAKHGNNDPQTSYLPALLMNTTLRVAYSNGGTLPDYAAPRVKTVSMQCCLQSPGTTYCSDYGSVNAAHSDYSTDFPGGYPNNGAASFVEGRWQHVVITFDGSGTQTGVFWNGQQQDPSDIYSLHLGPLPFGPITAASFAYDAGRAHLEHRDYSEGEWAEYSPLQGDLSDIQFYDYELTPTQVTALYGGSTSACAPPPSPPPSPPSPPLPSPFPPGVSAPPPNPPPSPPLSPGNMQATLSLCVAGYAVQEFRQYRYDSQLGIGVGIFLGIPAYDVVFVNVSSGCSAPVTNAAAAPAGRRHLAQTPVPAPPPPDPSCLNVTAGQPLPAGCVPALYNASSSITAMLDITLPVARATTLLAALDALGNGTSPGAANLTALLRTVGLSQLQGLRLPSDAEGASLLAAAALVLASQPPPPPPPRAPWPPRPPRPPPDAPGTVDKDKSGKFSSKSTRRKDAALDAGSSAGVALAAIAALWFIVHAVVHAAAAAHQRRTAVSVAVVVQCTTDAALHADGAHDDDVHGVHVTSADAGSLTMTGKRFKAPRAAALVSAFLEREAAAANALDALSPPKTVTLRPLQRTPLVRAAAAKKEHAAGSLALRKKPTGVLWRLKRWVQTELRWQAREMRTLGRALRRCCGGSRDAVGKVFRLVRCRGTAVRDAAEDATDPAHEAACALVHPGSAPTAVLFEVTFHFGVAGRDAAAVWRQRLRTEAQLAQLEAALGATLAEGAESDEKAKDFTASELRQVGTVTISLLDDEPHACLDKKRAMSARLSMAHGGAGVEGGASAAADAAARSFGLVPPVAKRLAAVLLLSLRDAADDARAPRPSDAAV